MYSCSLKSASTDKCLVCDIYAIQWIASTLLMGEVCMQIRFDFNRNKYFDTKEALEYGIIDQVVRPLRTQTLGV